MYLYKMHIIYPSPGNKCQNRFKFWIHLQRNYTALTSIRKERTVVTFIILSNFTQYFCLSNVSREEE